MTLKRVDGVYMIVAEGKVWFLETLEDAMVWAEFLTNN